MGAVHLHTASGYSARYGASHPEDLARRAAERGITALALTDRDTVAGTVRFAQACLAAGVRPLFGTDLAVAAHTPGPVRNRRTPVRGGAEVVEPPLRVTLLARDRAGWARLCRLVSAAHAGTRPPGRALGSALDVSPGRDSVPASAPGPGPGARTGSATERDTERDSGHPRADWAALAEHATGGGLTVLLGPLSEPVRALAAGRPDRAEQLLTPWLDLFGPDALRLETVCYGLPGTGPGSVRLATRTLELADRTGIPAVLTNAVRYADPAQHRLADVLDAARLLRPIDRGGRPGQRPRLDSGERWLKDPDSLRAVAERITGGPGPRAARLLADTLTTADQCRVDPAADLGLGQPHFPEPELVGATADRGAGTGGADRLLREQCAAGLRRRGLDRDADARARLEEELGVIAHKGYATYFLTVARVVADIREAGIRVAARGSGAGSLVNHLLDIATANPLEHRLRFERFTSVRRHSLPDIDLDVESARRLEAYDRIFQRFGPERVAVTGMPETYRARHALRDTGLALGIAPADVDRVAKSFPHIRAGDITAALHELPELRSLAAEADRYGPLWELAEGLDALPRGMAMHPCGVILTDASLLDRLPVQPAPTGYPVVQADKEDVENLGLIKLDVLGVRMQSTMAHAVAEIRRTTGRSVDLDDPRQVPLDDPDAFELLRTSRTLGMFQLESPGQMDLLSRLQPRDTQDVIADISLFRPGPVQGGMPERYIAARHGDAPEYPHPDLEPVLADTYGVTIWHEQIIDMLAVLTGCDRAMAEEARRALGDRERLPRVSAWFHQHAAARGYAPEVLRRTWEIIESFSSYGFCRAHAVAFAVPALQSAWLKAHHPAALYAGLLEHDPGMWPRRVIVADARRHGVPVRSVDINLSGAEHTVEQDEDGRWCVRLALSAVKGIGAEETRRLAAHRPYSGVPDLWRRGRPSLPTAERLTRIGALDALLGTATRRDVLLHLTELHRQGRSGPLAGGGRRNTTAGRDGTGTRDGTGPRDAAGGTRCATGTSDAGQLLLDDGGAGGDGGGAEGDGDAGSDGGGDRAVAGTAPASGLPEMTSRESLDAELTTLSIDVSHHLMDHHHQLLREIGATDAAHLPGLRQGQPVLVAGVRAATQTPPIPSGKRIIFVTLEDGSGLVDLAFFEDSHETCAYTVFHHGLLLVRGTVQRRGRRATVVGEMVWDLDAVAAAHRDRGPDAALRLLHGTDDPSQADDASQTQDTDPGTGSDATGSGTADADDPEARPDRGGRSLADGTAGARLHPWADLQPAGTRSADLTSLSHRSPGSAG